MPAIAGIATALAEGAGAIAPEALAAAPEVAAAAAPEVAGAIALPEIAVTAPALAAGAGTEAALGGGAAAAGLGAADVAGAAGAAGVGAGLGSLFSSPAFAGTPAPGVGTAGTVPSSITGRFGGLPTGTESLPISAVPGFGPGGAPLPTARPAGIGGGGPASPGAPGVADPTLPDTSTPTAGTDSTAQSPDLGHANFNNGVFSGIQGVGPAAPAPAAPSGLSSLFPSGSAGLLGLGAAGIGGSLLAPQLMKALGLDKVPQQGALESIAKQAQGIGTSQQAYGTQLEQPLATGTLPPAQQAQVDQALQAANAATKSKFANLGLTGSTMEAEALQQNQQQSLALKGTLENQMAATGQAAIGQAISALGIQDTTIGQIMNAQVQQDTALQQSIGQFAAAVGGGTALGTALRPTQTA